MRNLLLLILILMIVSCGGSSENHSNESSTSEEVATNDNLDMSSGDSLIATYKRLRKEAFPDEEYTITGEVFYEYDDYFIVNLIEFWDPYTYSFAIEVNGTNMGQGSSLPENGTWDGITDLLQEKATAQHTVYLGNFNDGPGVIVEPYRPLVLEYENSFHTTVEVYSTFFMLVENDLRRTAAFTHTSGEAGECEEIKGYSEKFAVSKDKYSLLVKRNEYYYNEMCELQDHIAYDKVWGQTSFFGGEGVDPDVPLTFQMSYSRDVYSKLPNEMTLLHIENEDTLRDAEQVKFSGTVGGGNVFQYAYMTVLGMQDFIQYLIIDIKEAENGNMNIICRHVGGSGDGLTPHQDALNSSEENLQCIYYSLEKVNESTYILHNYPNETHHVYTTSPNNYKEVQWEEEY